MNDKAPDSHEALAEKARHKQEMTRLEHAHDEIALAGLPFSARMYFDPALYDRMMLMADKMSASRGMPKHIQGDPIMALYCIERGWSWRMSPLAVAMGTFKIGEAIGHFGRIIISAINNSGRLEGSLQFDHFEELSAQHQQQLASLQDKVAMADDDKERSAAQDLINRIEAERPSWDRITANFREMSSTKKQDEHGNPVKYLVPGYTRADEIGLGVAVRGQIKGEDKPRILKFYLKQAWPRNSTLWATDPKTQICYTAARRFGSLYVPDVIAGTRTEDDFEQPMVDITPADQQPQQRQPSKPTVYLKAYDAWGSEYQLQAGEVANWIANRCVDGSSGITAATADELDALLENNDEPAIKDAIEKAIARLPRGPGPSGGGGNRNTPPQAVRMPPGDDRSGAPDDTGASGRGAQQGADAAQSASSGPSAGKRTRRSYHDIKADVLAALASAADLAEVERIMKNDITSGVRANRELMDEIEDAEKSALARLDRDVAAASWSASSAGPVMTVLGKPAATYQDAERMIDRALETAESANAITDADYDALGVDIKALQPHMPKAAAAFIERLDALPAEDHGDEPAEDASGDSDFVIYDNGRVVEPQDTQKADEPAEVYGLRDAKGQPYGEPVAARAWVDGLIQLAERAPDRADRGSIRAYNNKPLDLIAQRHAGDDLMVALVERARRVLA